MLLTVYCFVFGGVNSLRSRPAVPEDDPAGSKHVGECYN
jgi:hypothetical protein